MVRRNAPGAHVQLLQSTIRRISWTGLFLTVHAGGSSKTWGHQRRGMGRRQTSGSKDNRQTSARSPDFSPVFTTNATTYHISASSSTRIAPNWPRSSSAPLAVTLLCPSNPAMQYVIWEAVEDRGVLCHQLPEVIVEPVMPGL